MPIKAIQLLVNEALPEDIRDYSRKYDKGSINELMTTVAEKYPDRYADIIDDIKDIGRHSSYFLGETLTLDDFKPVFDKSPLLKQMESEVDLIRKTVKDQKKKDKAIKDVYGKYATLMEKMTIDAGKTLPKENNLFNAVTSGARGNNTQLKAIVTSPGVYTDYKGDMIPLFIKNSYGEGLSLPEYLSSVYGVRQSTISSKRQTAKGGGLGKEMNRAALTTGLITKAKDLSDNGIDLNVDDDSLYGRVLARDTAGYPKGTVVDRDVINTLRKNKIDTVIVHSPLATISAEGIPAEAFGLDFNKQLPNIGDHVGLQATTALSEPVVQGSLSSKHTAGMYQGKKTYAGLEYIEQFLQSPETFKDRAAVSEFTGKVEDIKPAPQGGSYIIINGQEHYVLPNMDIFVKKGDEVEAGQILSDGLADPEDIVRLRGIGEGRKYFTDRFKQILDESGAKAHRRNVELLARSFVDKVKITDPDGLGDFLPEDVISYNALEANYVPEKDTKAYSVDDENAVGKYLQKPVLHYSIGTKLLPSMLKHIKKTGISDNVFVSEKEPKFEPVLIRLREAPLIGHNDFIGKGIASYQKSNYLDSAITGAQSNIKENLNPYVRMAQPDFAEKSKQTGKF